MVISAKGTCENSIFAQFYDNFQLFEGYENHNNILYVHCKYKFESLESIEKCIAPINEKFLWEKVI